MHTWVGEDLPDFPGLNVFLEPMREMFGAPGGGVVFTIFGWMGFAGRTEVCMIEGLPGFRV